jgi:hypothetical protein
MVGKDLGRSSHPGLTKMTLSGECSAVGSLSAKRALTAVLVLLMLVCVCSVQVLLSMLFAESAVVKKVL